MDTAEDRELDQTEAWFVAEERLSVLRHDLRNHLGTLRNASFYLQRKTEKSDLWTSDGRVPYFFSLMEEELKKAEALLANQFSVASELSDAALPVSLARCVERAVASLQTSAQIELVLDLPRSSALIPVREIEVAVLVRCLLRNAVEAAPRGNFVQVRTRLNADAAWLEICDPGEGFGQEWEARAFQPFTGTKPGHAGVGLNVARRVCQRYGAELRFRRPPSGGFTAEVLFPRKSGEG